MCSHNALDSEEVFVFIQLDALVVGRSIHCPAALVTVLLSGKCMFMEEHSSAGL